MMRTICRYWIDLFQTTILVRMGPQKLRELTDGESTFCKVFSSNKKMDRLNIEFNLKSMHLLSSKFSSKKNYARNTQQGINLLCQINISSKSSCSRTRKHVHTRMPRFLYFWRSLYWFLTLGLDSSFHKVCDAYMPSFGEKD